MENHLEIKITIQFQIQFEIQIALKIQIHLMKMFILKSLKLILVRLDVKNVMKS